MVSVQAATVNFANQGSFTTSQFSQNGVTVTGSNTLQFTNGVGFGVVGNSNQSVDSGESALFAFSPGGASNVSLQSNILSQNGGGTSLFSLEGFGLGGNSLGKASVSFGVSALNINVSGLFKNATLSAFRFTSDGLPSPTNGAIFSSLTFTPVSVPTPALLPGLVGMGIAAFRKKRKSEPSQQIAEVIEA
ncbi:MAG: PTPA-CTERM sorting domain-containing protein [Leptolyngbya sp. BL-A-14]